MGKKMVLFFSLLLTTIPFFSSNATSSNASVVIELDEDDIVCELDVNGTYTANVLGSVICEMDGYGQSFQYIEVRLYSGNAYGISTGVSPDTLLFYSNGEERFNLTVFISEVVVNGTVIEMMVKGNWQAKNYRGWSVTGGSGDAVPDTFNVTVSRKSYTHYSHAMIGPLDEPAPLSEVPDFWPLSTVASVISVIVIASSVFLIVRWRRKRKRIRERMRK